MCAKRFTFKILHEQQKRADLGKLLRGRKVPIPHRYDNPYFIQEETGIKAPLMKTFKLGATTKPKISQPSRPLRARFLPLPSEKVTLRLPSNDDNIAIKNELSNTATTTSLLKDGSFSDLGLVFGALGHYSKVAKAINDSEYGYDDDDEAAMTSADMLDPYNTPVEPLGTFEPPTAIAAPVMPLMVPADDMEIPIKEEQEEPEIPGPVPQPSIPVKVLEKDEEDEDVPQPPLLPHTTVEDLPATNVVQGLMQLKVATRAYLENKRAEPGQLQAVQKLYKQIEQKIADDASIVHLIPTVTQDLYFINGLISPDTKLIKARRLEMFEERFNKTPSLMHETYEDMGDNFTLDT